MISKLTSTFSSTAAMTRVDQMTESSDIAAARKEFDIKANTIQSREEPFFSVGQKAQTHNINP